MTGTALRVAFRAEPGEGPLTWGQLHIWSALKWFGDASAAFNVQRVAVPDEGALGPAELGAPLRRLIEEQHVLRTRFVEGPDGPRQVVAAEGEYTVEVVEAGDADPARVAEEHAERLAREPFRLDREWPVRLALVCRDGRVRAVAVAASHVAVDGWAVERLRAALGAIAAGAPADLPADWQPLDQAAYERSERGRRQGAKALAFWRARLATVPDAPSPPPRRTLGEPRVQRWAYCSDEIALASMAVAKRTGTSSSTVLLTLAAATLGILRGHATVAMQLIAANRSTQRQRRLLAAAAQDGLLVLPVPATDLDSAVREVYREATTAYFHAQYDPQALAAVRDEARPDRRHPVDLSGYFNDGRLGRDWEVPARPRPGTPPALTRGFDRHDMTFCLGLAQRGGRCEVSLLADTALIAPDDIPRVLTGLRTVLTEARERRVDMAELPALLGLASGAEDVPAATPTRNGACP